MFFDEVLKNGPLVAERRPADDAPPAIAGPLREAEMRRFRDLYAKFKDALRWINPRHKDHVHPDRSRKFNPEFEGKLKKFEMEVEAPMDAAWNDLNDAERALCDPFRKGGQ